MKKFKNKLVCILALTIISLSITGCTGDTTKVDYSYITEVSRTVSYDKEALRNEALAIISGESTDASIVLNQEDIISNPLVNNEYYFFNTVYFQIQNYMYRFQLDNNNKIVSYIRYKLEA